MSKSHKKVFSLNKTKKHIKESEGPYVRLTVSDTGAGIDETTLKKIFDPYFKTKEFGKGTGMVHGIVKNHEGTIEVHSKLGKGSTFIAYLPQAETPPAQHPLSAVYIPIRCIRARSKTWERAYQQTPLQRPYFEYKSEFFCSKNRRSYIKFNY